MSLLPMTAALRTSGCALKLLRNVRVSLFELSLVLLRVNALDGIKRPPSMPVARFQSCVLQSQNKADACNVYDSGV
jgi:hypothetical protein